MVQLKIYKEPEINIKEILRYSGCREADEKLISEINNCIEEAKNQISYSVCYDEFPVSLTGDCVDAGFAVIRSHDLRKNLEGCSKIIVFAATIGSGIDRLIMKYSRLSPSKALFFQAIGSERVESLCDAFNKEIKQKYICKPRFSPGYGDLPLDIQKNIFAALSCEKNLCLTLGENLFMSPSKSVTAIIGIKQDVITDECQRVHKQ